MNDLPKKSSGLGDRNSADSGLGGGKGLGGESAAPAQLGDPQEFGPAAFAEETNANWHRASLLLTIDMSEGWFGKKLVTSTVKDRLRKLGLSDEYKALSENFLAEKLPTGMDADLASFGELQELRESPLAQKVIDYLNGREVVSLQHGLVQVSENGFINTNDLDGSNEAAQMIDPSGDHSNTWMGPWGTGFGSRFLENFRVYKNDAGVETAVWFTNAVIATRTPERDSDGRLAKHEVFRREVLIPTLAKRVLYLAETPFPSSMALLGRGLAFQGLDEAYWPRPLYNVRDFELTVCTITKSSGDVESNFHIFPQVVNFGWSFTASETSQIEILVPAIIDSISTLMSILEDGFRNYPTLESEFSWLDIFGPPSPDPSGLPAGARARWIPATQLGALVNLSNELNNRGYQNANEQDLRWVAENGAGSATSNAINTLVYSHLLPAGKFDEARDFLDSAIKLNHFNESTNAMTNLGQVLLAAGEVDEAENVLLAALDRDDKYSEGEASLFLGDIYAGRNDGESAQNYYRRAVESGHPEFAQTAQSRLNGESPKPKVSGIIGSASVAAVRAKFCISCGTVFGDESQKFCASCGNPR